MDSSEQTKTPDARQATITRALAIVMVVGLIGGIGAYVANDMGVFRKEAAGVVIADPAVTEKNQAKAKSVLDGLKAVDDYQAQLDAAPKYNEGNGVVARIGDWTLTLDEVDAKAGRAHLSRLKGIYAKRYAVIEEAMAAELYRREAAKRGISEKRLFDEEMAKVKLEDGPKPSGSQDKEAAYALMQDDLRRRMYEQHQAFVVGLAREYKAKMMLNESGALAEFIKNGGSFLKEIAFGSERPKALVEVFSDFQCPYCAQAAPNIDRLLREYSDRVRFIFVPVIGDGHAASRIASIIGMCIYEQDPNKFLAFQREVYGSQAQLPGGEPVVMEIANKVGARSADLAECSRDPDIRTALANGVENASERGVSDTPTVMIGSVPLVGAQDYSEYKRVMEAVLSNQAGG